MSHSQTYLLGRSRAEEERLCRQARHLARDARWLLDRLHIPRGGRAMDIGCGPQGILDMLSERVGPQGRVVGLEASDQFVTAARKFVAHRQFGNVEIVQRDAKASRLPRESFDVVFARLVLVNVAEPERVVEEMVALTRPGGMVASYEADHLSHVCDPPLPAWDRLFGIFHSYARTHGIDLFIGRKTHRLLRSAGLEDVRSSPVLDTHSHRHQRRTILLDFIRNTSDRAVQEGFVGEKELTELVDEVRCHVEKPDTLVVPHLFFRTWGRKPKSRAAACGRD